MNRSDRESAALAKSETDLAKATEVSAEVFHLEIHSQP